MSLAAVAVSETLLDAAARGHNEVRRETLLLRKRERESMCMKAFPLVLFSEQNFPQSFLALSLLYLSCS